MKNKKGFTLIEIIICISLIAIISTISIVIFTKNKDYSNITKKILEAANVYIATEKDEQGNTYEYGINNGGKGIKINVNELVNKGYVDEKLYKTLEKEYKLGDDRSYLIWITNSINKSTDEECGVNALEYTVNWKDVKDVIYLCPYNSNINKDETILINKLLNQEYNTDCENSLDTNSLCLSHGKNVSDDENLEDIYYFKGKVDNNYIKFEGLDKLFRIIRTTENNGIKIIEDEEFDLSSNNVRSKHDYVMFYSKYNKSNNENRIKLSGYTIEEYMPYTSCYCKPNGAEKINTWDDSKEIILNCSTSSRHFCPESEKLQSPIYQYVYQPIKEYYEAYIEKVLKNYINKDYKWCDSSYSTVNKNNLTSFKCSSEKNISSDFGLLLLDEYLRTGIYNSIHIKYKSDYLNFLDYGEISSMSKKQELTFDIEIAKSPADSYSFSSSSSVIVRIAYVIKNDVKVISGNGTKNDPYIISE